MIIPEDTVKTPIAEEGEIQERPHPSASQYTPLQGESPPAYYRSSSQSPLLPRDIPQPYQAETQIIVAYRYGRSPTARFLRAFFVAWVVWIFIALLIQSFVIIVEWVSDGWQDGKIDPHFDYDVPSGIALSNCIQGSEWTYQMYPEGLQTATGFWKSRKGPYPGPLSSAHATFDLPLESANIFIMTRGQLSSGTLDITTSPTQPSNKVTVRVNIQYITEDARNLARVCKLAHKLGQEPEGVGIFTPRWRNGHHERDGTQMVFAITVILPEVDTGDAPLFLKGFETDVPLFLHRFADLNEKVHFGSLVLKSSNAPVDVKSLSATDATVRNTNGYIKGIFNTTKSLMLQTTNSPIHVNVSLQSTEGSKPSFTARTNNGPIEAAISLSSKTTSPNSASESYTVITTSSNGDLFLEFPTQPMNSKLHLTATTTNGPARVHLNPAYEGDFVLQSPTTIVIHEGRNVEDPSGAGRRRSLEYKSENPEGTQVIAGSVRWGAERKRSQRRRQGIAGDGHVTIRNTNAPLTFEL